MRSKTKTDYDVIFWKKAWISQIFFITLHHDIRQYFFVDVFTFILCFLINFC